MGDVSRLDGRNRPRMSPPQRIGKRQVQVLLDPADYRTLYELTLRDGGSMQETLRRLIRDAGRGLAHV